MTTVRVSPLVLVGSGAVVATEVAWQLAWGVPSPARAVLYVSCAVAIGDALLAVVHRRARVAMFDAFAAGAIVLGLAFSASVRLGAVRAFAPAAFLAAILALVWRRPRRWLQGNVHVGWLLVAPLLFALVVRAVWFTDRLDLTVPHPDGFAWIDTPLWLSLAHGAERGAPPPDLLYAGGTVNYHFGSALVIASMRRLTGLPVHAAYFSSMVVFQLALCAGLSRSALVFLRAARMPRMCAAVFGLVLVEHVTLNFPSVVALPLLIFLTLQVFRLARPLHAVPLVVGAFFLMITKEVEYVLFFLLGGAIAGARYWRQRKRLTGIALFVAGAATRPFYERLIRIDQRALLRPFREHLDAEWIRGALAAESTWLVVGLLATLFAFSRRRTHLRFFAVLAAALAAFACGMFLTWFVKPDFDPPMDAFSYGWILFDMAQFVMHGRFVLGTTLVLVGLAVILQDEHARRVRLPAVTLAALLVYGALNFWKSPAQSPSAERPEDRGPDAVVPLLARIDPATSVIAADRINWNHENPHWAAFFGHQFYLLRMGRWTTAYRDFNARLDSQNTLFSTEDEALARRIIARDGITHVIMSAQRPIPWLAREAPIARSGEYSLFLVRTPAPGGGRAE